MIRYTTAGESHGSALAVIIEGIPAGLALDEEMIAADLARRQIPLGAGARMSIETDRAEIVSGVMAGITTGAPIALSIPNRNHSAWKGRDVAAYTAPRPGHADWAACVKWGYDDIRPALERASARETAARVAAGAVCRAFLARFGIEVRGRVAEIGGIPAGDSSPALSGSPAILAAIDRARAEGETLGGVIEIAALSVPPGLGSSACADARLDARLAGALMGMQAIKGVEIGDGFALARACGSAAQDAIFPAPESPAGIVRRTNRMGGLEGGITNGESVVLRIAMKPIPTVMKSLPTVDLATGEASATVYERSDYCPVPRAVVVAEAIVCTVIADALAAKLGGDSIEEMLPRFAALRRKASCTGAPKRFWP